MSDAGFTKVTRSEKLLYGPRKLLICGFSSDEQYEFTALLQAMSLTDIPLVWVTDDKADMLIDELVKLEDGTGEGISSNLSRAIIMAGIAEKELHQLMAGCRQSGMKRPLYATMTPISETWTIQNLLTELAAEHKAMQKRKR